MPDTADHTPGRALAEPRVQGCMRRRIVLRSTSPGLATGRVQDDVHDFAVSIEHADGVIRAVAAEARRFPWTTCPGATLPLRQLEGQALFERAGDIGRAIKMSTNCTHMFELAGLVVAQAARGDAPGRTYEAVVPDREVKARSGAHTFFEPGEALLYRDGAEVLRWRIEEPYILEPQEFAGRSLVAGFREWTDGFDPDLAEAMLVLRRAIHISGGRVSSMPQPERAIDMGFSGVCFSFQPDRIEQALNTHSKLDFAQGFPAVDEAAVGEA